MKMISLAILLSLIASGCSNHKHYVTFKNYSDDQIYVERGQWGEWAIRGGYIARFSKENIFPPGKTHAGLPGPIPNSIGVFWKNSNDVSIEEYVEVNENDIPKLLRGEGYQFVVTLTQSKIRQLEVVVHLSGNARKKKRKAMLYCSEGEGVCDFMTPFTTDSYYDPEKLTDAQKEELESKAEIMKNFESELKKGLCVLLQL
jgi:hypothetical protein